MAKMRVMVVAKPGTRLLMQELDLIEPGPHWVRVQACGALPEP